MDSPTTTYEQRARARVERITARWRSHDYRVRAAMREADFLIGLLAWVPEESHEDIKAAIALYAQLVNAEPSASASPGYPVAPHTQAG